MATQKDEMSFLDHLEELRWHLIRSTIAILVVGLLAFIYKDYIFEIIFGPKQGDFFTYRMFCKLGHFLGYTSDFCAQELPFSIQNRTMAGQFSAHIWTSIWAGIIICFPYILYEVWKFISPGLYENERNLAGGFIVIASALFFTGTLFGYYLIAPLSVNFLGTYSVSNEVSNQIDLSSYIAIVRSSVISCGLVFELPIIVYFLTKLGLITPTFMRTYRKHAVVLVLILAAIITPPDVASQIIVAIPIMILYEISIFISKYVLKKQEKQQKTNA
ncbi:twin-arginine translocase subunit TatC [Capnocytophaga sp.]|uniref:twin-arginine translocase subunit TatC n=1 Tax=Capnocytophaga sp. TaxID=44737 RepID=UPI0026DB7E2B|nr:twin-arginine translocase subunit TatC [Capnocytophaga sp.]MDO5106547.1 twin-arginine translocase subunit TatC [Capnocytophaga sp.]